MEQAELDQAEQRGGALCCADFGYLLVLIERMRQIVGSHEGMFGGEDAAWLQEDLTELGGAAAHATVWQQLHTLGRMRETYGFLGAQGGSHADDDGFMGVAKAAAGMYV